jgi:hypothetical protein
MKRLIAILALCLLPAPASAWGPMGHAIVAGIAAREIAPATRSRLESLIGPPATERMADVSSWADWQGRDRPETKPWHYVDIEIGSAGYDAKRDCPAGDCIVGAIAREEAILRDRNAGRDQRAEALVWLIHLLGDLHQPLHCADDHDRGGNQVTLWTNGRRSNLHAVWDRAPTFLPEAEGGQDVAAEILDGRITPAERRAWRTGRPDIWANESFRIARDRIYAPMLAAGGARNVGVAPPDGRIVRGQIEKAGIRLAMILDRDLK